MIRRTLRVASSMAAAVLALSVITGSIPTGFVGNLNGTEIVASADDSILASGYCGANNANEMVTEENMGSYDYNTAVQWQIYNNGGTVNGETAYTLRIYGSGAMANFEHDQYQPWFEYAKNVTDVYVIQGITSIGQNAFSNYNGQFPNLNIACIGKDVRKIDKWAFEYCTNLSHIYFENAEALRNVSAGESGWNIYDDGDDENNAFHGCGSGSKIVENDKHIINLYYANGSNTLNSSLFDNCINIGDDYSSVVTVKASERKEFPASNISSSIKIWNNRKNIFANLPEGTECYRRIQTVGSAYYLIRLDAQDMNELVFSQVENSKHDEIFVKLPEKYTMNHTKRTNAVDMTKIDSTNVNAYYDYEDGALIKWTPTSDEKAALQEFAVDYVYYFGGNEYAFYPVTYNSDYTEVGAVAPTCVTPGNVTYWYDEANDKYYTDPYGNTETTKQTVTIPATGQHKYENGKCIVCGKWERNEAGYTVFKEDGIVYNVYPSYAVVADCDDDIAVAKIKSEVNDVPVIQIGENAFNSKHELTKVEIPDTVTTIKKSAFWGATGLQSFDVPETVTSIENGAFTHCPNLTEITIRNPECVIGQSSSTVSNTYDYTTSLYEYIGTIYGIAGSTAQAYAEAHGYYFAELSDEVKNITVDPQLGMVQWDKSDEAVAYRIIKKYNNKTYYGKKTTDTFYFMDYTPAVEYELIVRSYNANGIYTDSEPVKFESSGLAIAKEPSITEKGVVSWEPVEGAVAYRVVKSWGGKTYYSAKTTDCMMAVKYDSNTSYDICIRAYDADGNYTDGAILSLQGQALGKVTDVTVTPDGEVIWSNVPNAVEYKVGKVVDGKTYFGSKITGTSYIFNTVPKKDYQVFVVAFNAAGANSYGTKVDVKVSNE